MENVFYLVIQFTIIIMFGMFWYKLFNWTPEESIGMAVLSAITIVFVGAFIGLGLVALFIIYALSLVGFSLFVVGDKIKWLNKSKESRRSFFTPGIIILSLFFVYGIIAFNGLHINNWDEMHQWGKAVNFMLHKNALPMGEEFDGEAVLLSTTTIFHYFFCKMPKVMTGSIVESNMYVSNLVLWMTAVILPLSGKKWKQWKEALIYVMVVFLSMNMLFIQPYYNIYCDQPVTMWTGAIIAWILFSDTNKKFRWIFIVLALMNISFMKNMMGPLFSCIIIVVLLLKYFFNTDKIDVKFLRDSISVKTVAYSVGCVISIFLYSTLWSLKISQNAVIRVNNTPMKGENRFSLTVLSGLSKWFEPVNDSNSFPNLTYLIFLLLCLIMIYWFARKYLFGKVRTEYLTLSLIYCVGFFLYFALMIYTYLTTFSYNDSIVTGSLNRYFSDYMLIGVIPIIFPAFFGNSLKVKKGEITVGATVILAICLLTTQNDFFYKATNIQIVNSSTYKERLNIEKYKEEALKLMDSNEKIYMINQDSNAYFTVAADYVFEDLIDRSNMCYYFTDNATSIAGLTQANIRALPQILLNGYGYLWIYKTDAYFSSNIFSSLKLPSCQEGNFYKIINKNGRLKLEYLGNLKENINNQTE